MRPRKDIEQDSRSWERLTLEVLLDIRDLLKKAQRPKTKTVAAPEPPKKRRGRPPKREEMNDAKIEGLS